MTDMSPAYDPLPTDAMREQAQRWLLRLQSGQATVDDADAFRRWRAADPRHAVAVARVRALWQALGPALQRAADVADAAAAAPLAAAAVATPALLPRTDEGRRQRRRPLNRGRRAFLGGAVAAAGGCWFIASSPLGMWPDVGSLRADFRTATGERRDLRIADVDVAMGARTRLSRVRGNALELEEGEAQFTLPAQTTAPFALQVQGAHVLPASGARVDIRCVGQDVRVSCLQGAVDIRLGQRHVHLQPGWQARLQGTRIAAVAPVPRERVDAWRQGWLVFDDQPLTQVVEEINRYRPGRVMIAGRELAQRRVQARIPLDRIDSIIQLVRDAYGARVLRMPGGVVVLG